ncbi:MAG TPA: S8 family serine peptidase, partial [Methanocella sp.]
MPGLAQNKAIDGTGDGESALVQVSVALDKDAGTASLSVPAIDGEHVLSAQPTAGYSDNNVRYDLHNSTIFNLLDSLKAGRTDPGLYAGMTGQPSGIVPFSRGGYPLPGKVNEATASSTDVRTVDVADGSSRYIVVFEDTSAPALQMAKAQVKGFAESQDGKVIHDYSIISGMAVSIPDEKAAALSSLDHVKYVEKDQLAYATLDRAVPQIDADEVQDLGYDGSGVKVCVIDTGIDVGHPDLNSGKVVGWVDFVKGLGSPYDDHGHGTHCAGTIAGTGIASGGQYAGVAPGASLMGAKVLGSDGSGSYSDILAAINWAVTNNANVISMSLGGKHSQALDDAVNNAISHNVTVVVAAGNNGQYGSGTIDCPGDNPNAITVGAVDRNDAIAYFSSRGPTSGGFIKPDVTSMGVGLVAARASGTSRGTPVNTYYTAMSGTSMATPMTAGVVALLLEKNVSLTPAQVKDALTKTAKPLGSGIPNNVYGYGRVQAKAAFDYVQNGSAPPASTPTPTPVPAGSLSIEWSRLHSDNASDFTLSVVQATDGGYVATGDIYRHGNADVYLVKTDATGALLWSRAYGGYSDDSGNSLNRTADGGYVIAGSTRSYASQYQNVYLIKTDSYGIMAWNKSYSLSGNDIGTDVLQTGDGGFVIVGTSCTGSNYSLFMIKTDSSGALLWNRTLGEISSSDYISLQPTSDNGFIIAGTCERNITYSVVSLSRVDSAGHLIWNRTYEMGADTDYLDAMVSSAIQTADGGFAVAGGAMYSHKANAFLLKIDSTGNEQWNKSYSGNGSSLCLDMRQTRDSGYILAGSTYGTDMLQSAYLVKTDGSGNVLWQNTYPVESTNANSFYSVRQTTDDGYIGCGVTLSLTSNSIEFTGLIVKTDLSGELQWRRNLWEPGADTCTWAQQTDDGGYVMTGVTDLLVYGHQASLVRLDRSGNLVWKQYLGGMWDDAGNMVLQNADGSYVVAGSTHTSANSFSRAYLVKTDASGDEQWSHAYDNFSDNWANALQMTPDGGYILAGGRYDPALGDCDAYLVKTSSTGIEQWNHTYGGYEDDWANSVLRTADGGYLYVGGSYSGSSGNCDIYVAKVNAAGTTVWHYNYYASSDVWGNAVLPTDGGYVIAGGARYGNSVTKSLLMKIDDSGNLQWYHYYGNTSYQEGMSLQPASYGGYLIGGTTFDDDKHAYSMGLMKTDASGNALWNKICPGAGNSYGYSAMQTDDGGYFLAGTSYTGNNSQAYLVKLSQAVLPQNHKPVQIVPAPAMVPGFETKGGITGRVTTFDTT